MIKNNVQSNFDNKMQCLFVTHYCCILSWPPSNTWFLGLTTVSILNSISIGLPVFCTAHSCSQHRHRPCYMWHLSQQTASMLCMWCHLKTLSQCMFFLCLHTA